MNISELARRLRISPKELQVLLPKFGFDLGRRAVKIDDQAARRIVREWPEMVKKMAKEMGADAGAQEQKEAVVQEQIEVRIPEKITVRELAQALNLPVARLMQALIKEGILANVNEMLDFDTAAVVAEDFNAKVLKQDKKQEEIVETPEAALPYHRGVLAPRPPVVVVMGHVDHGKTKLLDAIRKTDVMGGEAGGITQHIGAYQTHKNGRTITFLDTPGHEAFVSMRSRGARVADLAILVVAADDGVQPQTLEVIRIIQAARLPYVVAINKIDKPGADQERVKRQLSDLSLIPEEWGGKTICVPISAKQGLNIDGLLETVLLLADMEKEHLTADPNCPAVGTVIESKRDPGEGMTATVLVQAGTLKKGDTLAVRQVLYGRVKAMKDYLGRDIQGAVPSQPVKILGFKLLPEVGTVVEVKSGQDLERQKEKTSGRVRTFTRPEEEEKKPALLLIVEADGAGSLEALTQELEKLKQKEVLVKIVGQGFGNIRDSDVLKAEAQGARVVGFHVEIEPEAQKIISETNVPVFASQIIYEIIDEVKKRIEELLPPLVREIAVGHVQIVKLFRKDERTMIVGGVVSDGSVESGLKVHIVRRGKKMAKGEILEVRQGAEVLKTAVSGQEIGLKIKAPFPLMEQDMIEAYHEEQEARKLI